MNHTAGWQTGTKLVRAAAVLALISTLLTPAFAPTVQADHASDHDPLTRVMVRINSIRIHDDQDWGAGEFRFKLELRRYNNRCGPSGGSADATGWCKDDGGVFNLPSFSADSGETKVFDGVSGTFPYPRTESPDYAIPPEEGVPLYEGDRFYVWLNGVEEDVAFDDEAGQVNESFTQAQAFGLGSHTTAASGFNIGGYTVNYDIIRAPLADLHVTDIRTGNFADNSEDIVCVTVSNGGEWSAYKFMTFFFVDGSVPPNGALVEDGRLLPGGSRERCFRTTIAAGEHEFKAQVDIGREVPESAELNNIFIERGTIARTRGVGSGSSVVGDVGPLTVDPGTGPATGQPGSSVPTLADLTATGIQVKGKEPTGQNDCDPGRNDVTVKLKNQGNLDAGAFQVTVAVGGDEGDGGKHTVQSLAKDAEASVVFDNVKLEKGSRKLLVKVDTESSIVEHIETNNQLEVTVNCRNEGD